MLNEQHRIMCVCGVRGGGGGNVSVPCRQDSASLQCQEVRGSLRFMSDPPRIPVLRTALGGSH
eukprot:scaffold17876_cov77-Skeletonema_dohrnii-CCMP3373.AAC.5